MANQLFIGILGVFLSCLYVHGATVSLDTIIPGDGRTKPRNEWTVIVDYTGKLEDGEVFDSSIGKKPFSFIVGRGEVIPGWDEAIKYMTKGEFARVTIPPEFAYGADGIPGTIPKNATLIFEIALKGVIKFPLHIQIEDVIFSNSAMPRP